MENSPKTLLKVHLASQTFQFRSLIPYSSNSTARNSIDWSMEVVHNCRIFTIAYTTEIFHGEKVKIRHSILL